MTPCFLTIFHPQIRLNRRMFLPLDAFSPPPPSLCLLLFLLLWIVCCRFLFVCFHLLAGDTGVVFLCNWRLGRLPHCRSNTLDRGLRCVPYITVLLVLPIMRPPCLRWFWPPSHNYMYQAGKLLTVVRADITHEYFFFNGISSGNAVCPPSPVWFRCSREFFVLVCAPTLRYPYYLVPGIYR